MGDGMDILQQVLSWAIAAGFVLYMLLRIIRYIRLLSDRRKWHTLTEVAIRAIHYAREAAKEQQTTVVDTQHLLMGLLREGEGNAYHLLCRHGGTIEQYGAALRQNTRPLPPPDPSGRLSLSELSKTALIQSLAVRKLQRTTSKLVDTEHLLLGLLSTEPPNQAMTLLAEIGIDVAALKQDVEHFIRSAGHHSNEQSQT